MKKKFKRVIWISLSVIAILSIVSLLYFFGTQQSFVEFDGRLLGDGAMNLYQYAIEPEVGERCGGVQSWIIEKGYIFSDTSTIKTLSSTFRFVTKDIIDVYRSGGHKCATHPYSVDIYKDGTLIDSVTYIDYVNRVHSMDSCAEGFVPLVPRAYADDGTIYKRSTPDFRSTDNNNDPLTLEEIKLPEGKTGIEVDFGKVVWEDGTPRDCRKFHVIHSYNVVYPKNTIVVEVKNFAVNNSNLIFNINTNTQRSGLTGDIVIYNNPGIGGEIELYRWKNIDFVQGAKTYITIIPFSGDNVNLNLRITVEAYHTTADLTNLNGVLIFSSTVPRYFGSDSNSKYRIGIFGNETFELKIVDGVLVGGEECPEGLTKCLDGTCKVNCDEPDPVNWILIFTTIGVIILLLFIIIIAALVKKRKR